MTNPTKEAEKPLSRGTSFSDIDVDDFKPKAALAPRQDPKVIEEISEASGFPSRQAQKKMGPVAEPVATPIAAPVAAPVAAPPAPIRIGRRITKDRPEQINMKISRAVKTRFYQIAEEQGVSLADVFDVALEALDREFAAGHHTLKLGKLNT